MALPLALDRALRFRFDSSSTISTSIVLSQIVLSTLAAYRFACLSVRERGGEDADEWHAGWTESNLDHESNKSFDKTATATATIGVLNMAAGDVPTNNNNCTALPSIPLPPS